MKTYGVVKGEWLILGVRESVFEEKNTSILYTDENKDSQKLTMWHNPWQLETSLEIDLNFWYFWTLHNMNCGEMTIFTPVLEEDFSFIVDFGGFWWQNGKDKNLLLEPKGASLLGVKLLCITI